MVPENLWKLNLCLTNTYETLWNQMLNSRWFLELHCFLLYFQFPAASCSLASSVSCARLSHMYNFIGASNSLNRSSQPKNLQPHYHGGLKQIQLATSLEQLQLATVWPQDCYPSLHLILHKSVCSPSPVQCNSLSFWPFKLNSTLSVWVPKAH